MVIYLPIYFFDKLYVYSLLSLFYRGNTDVVHIGKRGDHFGQREEQPRDIYRFTGGQTEEKHRSLLKDILDRIIRL